MAKAFTVNYTTYTVNHPDPENEVLRILSVCISNMDLVSINVTDYICPYTIKGKKGNLDIEIKYQLDTVDNQPVIRVHFVHIYKLTPFSNDSGVSSGGLPTNSNEYYLTLYGEDIRKSFLERINEKVAKTLSGDL